MAQEKKVDSKSNAESKPKKIDDRLKEKKPKEAPPTKVVVRRLPPSLTSEQFLEAISPVAEHDYYKFHKSDRTLGLGATARAYINFVNQEDLIEFTETFDGYVFVDSKGGEYSAIVEFAPFQKVPKKKAKKADSKKGTIEEDNDYKKFLDQLENPESEAAATPEAYLEEIEQREREKENKGPRQTTPLLDYIKRKKEDRRAAMQKKPFMNALIEYDLDYERDRIKAEKKARDERKRREIERRKQREDDRRKRKDKDRDRTRDKERDRDRERKDSDGVPQFKLLKNPERDDKDGGNRNHSNSSDRKDDKSNKPKSWKEREAERRRERERERSAKKEKDGDKKYYDDDERVPSYARKDDKRDEQRKDDRRDDREKDQPSKATKEKYKEYKDNVKGMNRRYESGRLNRDNKDDKEQKETKKEPELRFSKKAREREKELKRERENNGKGRGDRGKQSDDRDSKGSQDKKDSARSEDGREESAAERKEKARRERIRNKDRPERAIYVPGAARRAQQQKGATSSKSDSKSSDRKSTKTERTESSQDSYDSEGPSNERTEKVDDDSPPNEAADTPVDVDKADFEEVPPSDDKGSTPEECTAVKQGVSEPVVSEECAKEDEA